MTRNEFLEKFDPSNPDDRKEAQKIVCEPPINSKVFRLPAWYSKTKLIEGPQEQTRQGYECPRAVFGAKGWEWRFAVEYFG